MEKNVIIKIIDQVNDYRFKRMRRDNLQWHLEKDMAGGYTAIAENRRKMLDKAQRDLDIIEPAAKVVIQQIQQLRAQHPRDKAFRLISLYIEMLDMDPMKMEKHRQKINALRPKVLGKVEEMEQIRQQNSLFD